jgi:hypothetical protein
MTGSCAIAEGEVTSQGVHELKFVNQNDGGKKMMKKLTTGALLGAMALCLAGPAQAAFTVGGENGWSLSTDGIVNIFGAYQMNEANNIAGNGFSLLNLTNEAENKFGVRVGLLPQIVALNVKAPTVNGIDSVVRVGFYPQCQNTGDRTLSGQSDVASRFNTSPNIDNREFFYTATGKYGQLLAGRALNLFQGQNILNDMTLFTAGVVDMTTVHGGTSLGHIGYGYLYTNFGPQFRYTTPDMSGVKVALEVGEPYALSPETEKTNMPRIEAEISYATKIGSTSIHAWLEGLWQQATRNDDLAANARPGGHNTSLGIAPGVNVQMGPVGLMASGYYGQALGMYSAQDGVNFGAATHPVDSLGDERTQWGFLAQTTYQLTDSVRLAANYGRTDQCSNGSDDVDYEGLPKTHEAAVGQVNWMLNKFTQFTFEYIWARDSFFAYNNGKDAKFDSHQLALGTVFFW